MGGKAETRRTVRTDVRARTVLVPWYGTWPRGARRSTQYYNYPRSIRLIFELSASRVPLHGGLIVRTISLIVRTISPIVRCISSELIIGLIIRLIVLYCMEYYIAICNIFAQKYYSKYKY